jgi:CheY-like chemotaxis protein
MTTDPPTILYVEDEARSRKVMQMLAIDLGVSKLFIFEDSRDFLARVETLEIKPDLVFLDIHVKPYNGFEMLKMLREMRRFDGIPIVAMTASVMNEEIQQLRAANFSGCLAKPIDMDTFPDSVNRIRNGESIWQIVS